jgi:hypothetical protein
MNLFPLCAALRVVILFLLPAASAQAYIDPGSGMLLIQGLLALVGGIVFFVKNPITAVKSWIARLRKKR